MTRRFHARSVKWPRSRKELGGAAIWSDSFCLFVEADPTRVGPADTDKLRRSPPSKAEGWDVLAQPSALHCRHRFQIALRHYDTFSKCCNTGSRIEDKRTAIDLTILKRDFPKTQGQVRWIEGSRMISDSLTKKVGSFFLRNVMVSGKWSLSDKGVQ